MLMKVSFLLLTSSLSTKVCISIHILDIWKWKIETYSQDFSAFHMERKKKEITESYAAVHKLPIFISSSHNSMLYIHHSPQRDNTKKKSWKKKMEKRNFRKRLHSVCSTNLLFTRSEFVSYSPNKSSMCSRKKKYSTRIGISVLHIALFFFCMVTVNWITMSYLHRLYFCMN